MLSLNEFKTEFLSQCRSAMSAIDQDGMKIEECMVNKSQRGKLNGLLFVKEGMNCAPTLYIEDFYREYKAGSSLESLSDTAVKVAVQSMGMAHMFEMASCESFKDKELLRVRMINRGRNREYLKDVPCRELGSDFVYVAEVGCGEYGAVLKDSLMDNFEMSEDEIFDKALSNTVRDYPAVLCDLRESAMGGPAECRNLLESPDGRLPESTGPGYVLTNPDCFWGAGTLFYPGMTERLTELMDGDFYVLPSSIHELILIKAEDQDPQQLADLVRSANREVVESREILADDLYYCRSGEIIRLSYGGVIPRSGDHVC